MFQNITQILETSYYFNDYIWRRRSCQIIFQKVFIKLNVNADTTIKFETCRVKYKYCDRLLKYPNFKYDIIEYKCLCCNKNYQQEFGEKLQE